MREPRKRRKGALPKSSGRRRHCLVLRLAVDHSNGLGIPGKIMRKGMQRSWCIAQGFAGTRSEEPSQPSPRLRAQSAPDGDVASYVGRLAPALTCGVVGEYFRTLFAPRSCSSFGCVRF